MATSGPRSKTEALGIVAAALADQLDQSDTWDLFGDVKMTPVQRQRAEEAMAEAARRLRLLDRRDPE